MNEESQAPGHRDRISVQVLDFQPPWVGVARESRVGHGRSVVVTGSLCDSPRLARLLKPPPAAATAIVVMACNGPWSPRRSWPSSRLREGRATRLTQTAQAQVAELVEDDPCSVAESAHANVTDDPLSSQCRHDGWQNAG